MSKVWFTADHHWGHSNIIEYCNRPFRDLPHMESTIMRRHNERVSLGDTVFHVGDFFFRESITRPLIPYTTFIERLNGHIILIQGNHDSNNGVKTVIQQCVIDHGGIKMLLIHQYEHAIVSSTVEDVDIVLCGHVHEKWLHKNILIYMGGTDYKIVPAINVGVDQWNFYPTNLRELQKLLSKINRTNKQIYLT